MGFMDEVGGFFGSIGGALATGASTVGHGLGAGWDAFTSFDQRAYKDVVSRPLATAFLTLGEADNTNDLLAPFSPSRWVNSWQMAQNVSPGQALVTVFQPGLSAKLGVDNAYTHGLNNQDPKSPTFNPAMFQQNFTSGADKWISGGFDAAFGWTDDPLVKLAGGFKQTPGLDRIPGLNARIAEAWRRPVVSQAEAQALIAQPRVQQFIDWTQGKTAAQILTHPAVKTSAMGGTVAGLLEGADRPTAELALRAFWGDQRALDEIVTSRADIAHRIQQLSTDNAIQAESLGDAHDLTDFDQPLSDLAQNQAQKLGLQAQTPKDVLLGNLADEQAQLEQRDNLLSRMQHAALGGLKRTPTQADQLAMQLRQVSGSAAGAVRSRLTDIRVPGVTQPIFDLVQRTAFDRPMQIVHAWTTNAFPHLIRFDDDQGWKQVQAWLHPVKALDDGEKAAYLSDYLKATTKGERQLAWDRIERKVTTAVVQAHGLGEDEARSLLSKFADKRGRMMNWASTKSRVYAAGTYQYVDPSSGAAFDRPLSIIGVLDDGIGVHSPLLETQLQQAMPMLDIERWQQVLGRYQGHLQRMKQLGGAGRDFATANADVFNRLWKTGVLMRVAFPLRFLTDEVLRATAKYSVMARVFEDGAAGSWNFLRNRGGKLRNIFDVRDWGEIRDQALVDTDMKTKSYLAELKHHLSLGDTQAADNVRTVLNNLATYRQAILAETAPKPMKYRLGEGTWRYQSKLGGVYSYPDAFAGENGDYIREITGSNAQFRNLVKDPTERQLQRARYNTVETGDYHTVSPVDDLATHTKAWVEAVNHQMLQSQAMQKVLEGLTPEEFRDWLKTAKGRDVAKQMPQRSADPVDWFNRLSAMADQYLPPVQLATGGHVDTAQTALEGGFNADFINRHWPDAGSRPNVHGASIKDDLGTNPALRVWHNATDTIMKHLGDLPADIASRHPTYRRMFQGYAKQILDVLGDREGAEGHVTLAEFNREVAPRAHRQALKDMKEMLYDHSSRSRIADTLRFVFPFFSAYQSQMRAWAGLGLEDLTRPIHAMQLYDGFLSSPNDYDMTTGQRATAQTPFNRRMFLVQLPGPVANAMGIGDFADLPIPVTSLTSAVTGASLYNPGFGPLVAVPANMLVKEMPQLNDPAWVNEVLPYGVSNSSLSLVLPGDVQKLTHWDGGPDDQTYSADVLMAYQVEYSKWQEGKRTSKPSWAEAHSRANQLEAIKAFSGFFNPLPFTINPQSPYKMYVDAAKNLKAADPQNWQIDYLNLFGTSKFILSASLGSDTSGVAPTTAAVQALKAYAPLIADHPELAAVVAGDYSGQYNQAAYEWELTHGPDGGGTYRQRLTPEQAVQKSNEALGWTQFNTVNSLINKSLITSGLTSVNAKGAENLKALKTAFVTSMATPTQADGSPNPMYNPDWVAAYNDSQSGTKEETVQDLQKLSAMPQLFMDPSRSDIRSLALYFQYREQVVRALAERTSKKLTSSTNADLAAWWENVTTALEKSDTKFSPVFQRFLTADAKNLDATTDWMLK